MTCWVGRTASGPTSSTCACCTWQPRPASGVSRRRFAPASTAATRAITPACRLRCVRRSRRSPWSMCPAPDLRGWLGRRERRALGRAEARADRVVLVPAAGGAVRDVRGRPPSPCSPAAACRATPLRAVRSQAAAAERVRAEAGGAPCSGARVDAAEAHVRRGGSSPSCAPADGEAGRIRGAERRELTQRFATPHLPDRHPALADRHASRDGAPGPRTLDPCARLRYQRGWRARRGDAPVNPGAPRGVNSHVRRNCHPGGFGVEGWPGSGEGQRRDVFAASSSSGDTSPSRIRPATEPPREEGDRRARSGRNQDNEYLQERGKRFELRT